MRMASVAQGDGGGAHYHHHHHETVVGGEAGGGETPVGTCYHCLWGHLGPGSFILWLGILLFLEALSTRRRKPNLVVRSSVDRMRVVVAMVGGVLMLLAELHTHTRWSWASLQHMTMYSMVMLDGLWVEAKIRGLISTTYLGLWEVGSLMCIGIQMANHNHGGPLMLGMHKLMLPVLSAVSVFLLLDRIWQPARPETREGLRLSACVLMSMLGLWFMFIGLAFWSKGDRGLLGNAHDTDMDPADAAMELTAYLAAHFMVSFTLVSTAWMLTNHRLPPVTTSGYQEGKPGLVMMHGGGWGGDGDGDDVVMGLELVGTPATVTSSSSSSSTRSSGGGGRRKRQKQVGRGGGRRTYEQVSSEESEGEEADVIV